MTDLMSKPVTVVDPGLQPQRTYQAWSRTIFSAAACSALLFKSSFIHESALTLFSSVSLAMFVISSIILRKIYYHANDGFPLLIKSRILFTLSFIILISGLSYVITLIEV